MESLVATLRSTGLCRGLDDDEIARIAERGRVEHWPEGALVMEEGASGPRLVVLLKGRVAVSKQDVAGNEHILERLGPGAILGEMSLVADSPRTATVRALEPLRLFAMDRGVFREMLEDGDPAAFKVGLALARVLAVRLDRLNERVVDLLHGLDGPVEAFDRIRHEVLTRWEFP